MNNFKKLACWVGGVIFVVFGVFSMAQVLCGKWEDTSAITPALRILAGISNFLTVLVIPTVILMVITITVADELKLKYGYVFGMMLLGVVCLLWIFAVGGIEGIIVLAGGIVSLVLYTKLGKKFAHRSSDVSTSDPKGI